MPLDLGAPQPAPHEQGRMQALTGALLRHAGALVEPIEPEGLEVLAPPAVQQALRVDEICRLTFGPSQLPSAQRVGIEADWLDRFGRLLGEQGRWTRRVVPVPSRASPADPERILGRELVLENATFRLLGVSPAWTRYLVLNFRISAVSDEKRDFMLRLGFNLATGASVDGLLSRVAAGIDHSDAGGQEPETNIPDDATLPEMWERAHLLASVGRALQPRVTEALAPFVKGLRRRLGRDQDRLHHYHNDLHREAMTRALALPTGDKRREREELRAQAILREYHAKLDDLSRQYATKVTVEWSQTLELVMRVHRFAVQIRRRKAERTVQLDWNPLARRLESPPCDYSASTERPRLVCDEALHLVAPSGLSPCQGCGKVFCRACHCERCPKCGAGEISSTGRLGILSS